MVWVLMQISAWNIIAFRDTVYVVWWLFLSNDGALIAQTNDLRFLRECKFKKTLKKVTCACCLCEYRTVNMYKMSILKHPNMYLTNTFPGRLNNWNFPLVPIHPFPEISITKVFLNEVKIPWNYPSPKCLYKQETMNKNIINERKISSIGIKLSFLLVNHSIHNDVKITAFRYNGFYFIQFSIAIINRKEGV